MEPTKRSEQPLGAAAAAKSLAACAARVNRLAVTGRLRQPGVHRGRRLSFADGTTAAVYRETRIPDAVPGDPAVLVVAFRLHLVRGPTAHAAFRVESLLNTVLFAGFPGFVSKLWLRHDATGRYRGVYQWDDAEQAESYVSALRYVLELVCPSDSIRHHVLPGEVRDEVLRSAGASRPTPAVTEGNQWWRIVDVQPPLPPVST